MNTNWEEIENHLQESFNDIKIKHKPCSTFTVTVLRGRNIRVGFFHDLVDIPDPKVFVTCEKALGRQKFRTKVAWDQYNPEWNETFTFVLPESFEQQPITSNPLILKIEAYEDDEYLADTLLGSEEINVTLLRPNQVKPMTINFGEHGEIDVLLCRRWRTAPDSRLSLGLGRGERKFRLQRKPKTVTALQKLFKNDSFPGNAGEAPNIALAITGGGYRAVAATAGAVEAFAESGLLDTFMYIVGLSGSSWYLSSAYVHNSLNDYESIVNHHDFLRKQMGPHLAKKLVNIGFFKRYRKYRNFKRDHRQTTNFVDLYGMAVGETFLGLEKIEAHFSDLCDYVKDGDVPFPIFTCSHVRDDKTLWEFCVDFEMSPYEISVPAYAINIPCDMLNSMWMNGIMQQKLPEPTLHYIMGASGSAFALMWNKVKFGNELNEDFLRYIDTLKTEAKEVSTSQMPDASSSEDDLPGPSSSDTERKKKTRTRKLSEKEEWCTEMQHLSTEQGSDTKEVLVQEEYGKGGIFKRSHRTALIHNVSLGQQHETRYLLNTQTVPSTHVTNTQPFISAKKKLISLCDSGLAYNLPAVSVLRPQRDINVMIVIHCDNYTDEEAIKYRLIAVVRKQANEQGMKFPKVDMRKIAEEPFKDLYIFEDEDDLDCPLVLWFTLANKSFRNQKELNLRPGFRDPTSKDQGSKEAFNDFSIFPESSPYGTFRLSFSPLTFDRVRELMRFNILTNVEVIKKRIADRIEMMRKSKSSTL